MKYDALIVGGGPAGLQAAHMLARAGRTVLVCDDDRPRNAPADHMHYFPTREGIAPADFKKHFVRDLQKYESIQFRNVTVLSIKRIDSEFIAILADANASPIQFKKLILATGVRDLLPPMPGLKELFGKSIFHCPFCHGYENRGKSWGVVGNGEMALKMLSLVTGLTDDIILFTRGPSEFSAEQSSLLKAKNIRIEEREITGFESVEGERGGEGRKELKALVLEDGSTVDREALLFRPAQELRSQLGQDLGLELNEYGLIRVDAMGRSSQEGIFVAGDNAEIKQSVLTATIMGLNAGVSAAFELAEEAFRI